MSPGGAPDIKKLKEKGNVKKLIKALSYQEDKFVRMGAARALGEIGDSRAVIPLIAALDDETLVRDKAAEALAEIADSNAVEPLLNVLKGSNESKNQKVIRVLGKIGDPRTVEPIIAELDRDYRNIYTFFSVISALEQFGDPRAIKPLIKQLHSSSWKIRGWAADALEKLGWQPGLDADGAAYWIAREEWEQCVRIGLPAIEPLLHAIKPADKALRKPIYEALGKMGPSAVEDLLTAINDADPIRRAAVINALATIGDSRAVEPLIDVVNGKIQYFREQAVEALGKIGDPKAAELLIALLPNGSEPIRIKAAYALGQIGDASAVEPLVQLFLKDTPIETLQAAASTLMKIYQSGQLDESQKRLILEKQGVMNGTHSDQQVHTDTGAGCVHDDYDSHSDKGINLDFPL